YRFFDQASRRLKNQVIVFAFGDRLLRFFRGLENADGFAGGKTDCESRVVVRYTVFLHIVLSFEIQYRWLAVGQAKVGRGKQQRWGDCDVSGRKMHNRLAVRR